MQQLQLKYSPAHYVALVLFLTAILLSNYMIVANACKCLLFLGVDYPLTMRRTSENPFTLTCTSTFLPPYKTWWLVDLDGADVETYSISSILTDRQESTYDNHLTIVPGNSLTEVIFRCEVQMQVQPYDFTDRAHPVSNYCEYESSCSSLNHATSGSTTYNSSANWCAIFL